MQTVGHSPPWTNRLTALFAMAVLVLFSSSVLLFADPPGEDEAPPPPMPESLVAVEAKVTAAIEAVGPLIREAQAVSDKMPHNVRFNIEHIFTPDHFEIYKNRAEYRRSEAEHILEARRDGGITDAEFAVRLADIEFGAYADVFDAMRDQLRLEGAILSTAEGAADWWVGDWYPDRTEEKIDKEKKQLAAFIQLAEKVVEIRERLEQHRVGLRIEMRRIVRRVESHDQAAAERMSERVEKMFREAYIDGSVENHLLGDFNHLLRYGRVSGSPSPIILHHIDAFIAPNLLSRAQTRLQLVNEGRAPQRRAALSLEDAHGGSQTGRVVSPGMTLELIVEDEGNLLPNQSLSLQHYRDNQPLTFGSFPIAYIDPQRAQDEGYARLIGRRGDVHTDSLYLSMKLLFVAVGQEDSEEARVARGNGWMIRAVEPGDVLRIVGNAVGIITLGVEAAQPKLHLVDADSGEVVPLEEMRYGVSYELELILGERHRNSDLTYQVVWGDGRFQNKNVLMMAVISDDEDVARTERRVGYTRFRSSRPLVFDDSSLPGHPRRER